MSGEVNSVRPYMANMDSPLSQGPRSLGNGRMSPTSPLKLFGQAKKKINDAFVEIASYIDESEKFLEDGAGVWTEIIKSEQCETVHKYREKVSGIREMLKRDRMKVAFFGRTSNGKSTVINSMLRGKILPSGIGHTTNCFVQVEGSDLREPRMKMGDEEEDGESQDIAYGSLNQLASALSSDKLNMNSLIRICWPKEKCHLLKDDVVLVDSPGIDVMPELDMWIDKFCLDADVFVLVANAESTLMQTEKNFFHKVSTHLSKPNIFILNNRWDCSASEPEMMEEVKKQHLERCVAFLADELGVVSRVGADDRVFFVSAREALSSRTNGQGTPSPGQMLDGFQGRLFEFSNFERKFEECISQSAVQTKFAQHTDNGKLITSQLKTIMETVYEDSFTYRNERNQLLQETQDRLDFTEKQLHLLTLDIKEKIKQMEEDVERKVASSLTDEIRRLAVLVDEFDRPFHHDPLMVNIYKKELHFHLEETISRNLHARCSSYIHQLLDATSIEMQERLTALLPEDAKQQVTNLLPVRDFEVAYRLDCRNLCADFREDIEFRFSLGLTALMNRFLGPRGTKSVLMQHAGFGDQIPQQISMTPQTPSNAESYKAPAPDNEVMVALLGSFTSLYSRSTIGALAITGVVAKAAGWRVLGVCGAIYGMLYVYERLTWTNRAKERAFKRQYVDYATSKLKLIVDLTSSNCSHQVQQELSSTFARLCRHVDNTKGDLEDDLKKLTSDITKLEHIVTKANFLKNKAGYLDSELDTFIHQYLKPDSML